MIGRCCITKESSVDKATEEREEQSGCVEKMKVDRQKSGFIKSWIELNCLFEMILCLTRSQASLATNQWSGCGVCRNVMTSIHQTVEGSLKCRDGYIISLKSHFQKGTSYALARNMIKKTLRAASYAERVMQNNNLHGFEVLFFVFSLSQKWLVAWSALGVYVREAFVWALFSHVMRSANIANSQAH